MLSLFTEEAKLIGLSNVPPCSRTQADAWPALASLPGKNKKCEITCLQMHILVFATQSKLLYQNSITKEGKHPEMYVVYIQINTHMCSIPFHFRNL